MHGIPHIQKSFLNLSSCTNQLTNADRCCCCRVCRPTGVIFSIDCSVMYCAFWISFNEVFMPSESESRVPASFSRSRKYTICLQNTFWELVFFWRADLSVDFFSKIYFVPGTANWIHVWFPDDMMVPNLIKQICSKCNQARTADLSPYPYNPCLLYTSPSPRD